MRSTACRRIQDFSLKHRCGALVASWKLAEIFSKEAFVALQELTSRVELETNNHLLATHLRKVESLAYDNLEREDILHLCDNVERFTSELDDPTVREVFGLVRRAMGEKDCELRQPLPNRRNCPKDWADLNNLQNECLDYIKRATRHSTVKNWSLSPPGGPTFKNGTDWFLAVNLRVHVIDPLEPEDMETFAKLAIRDNVSHFLVLEDESSDEPCYSHWTGDVPCGPSMSIHSERRRRIRYPGSVTHRVLNIDDTKDPAKPRHTVWHGHIFVRYCDHKSNRAIIHTIRSLAEHMYDRPGSVLVIQSSPSAREGIAPILTALRILLKGQNFSENSYHACAKILWINGRIALEEPAQFKFLRCMRNYLRVLSPNKPYRLRKFWRRLAERAKESELEQLPRGGKRLGGETGATWRAPTKQAR